MLMSWLPLLSFADLSLKQSQTYVLTSATAASLWKYVLCSAEFLSLFKLILFKSFIQPGRLSERSGVQAGAAFLSLSLNCLYL